MKALAEAMKRTSGNGSRMKNAKAGDVRLVVTIRTSENGRTQNIDLMRDYDSTNEQFAGALEALSALGQSLLDLAQEHIDNASSEETDDQTQASDAPEGSE